MVDVSYDIRVTKCPRLGVGGTCRMSIDNRTDTLCSAEIALYLPELYDMITVYRQRGNKISWDAIFSHAVSHEHIHLVIQEHVGGMATDGLDNLFGKFPANPTDVCSGVRGTK